MLTGVVGSELHRWRKEGYRNMRVRIVYRTDCPCIGAARANVDAALALLGRSAEVDVVPLETEDDAQREGMHGSPTVLIDGRDPFAPADGATTLTCRPNGAPTVRQLLEVLS
jgi:hypothetical protein